MKKGYILGMILVCTPMLGITVANRSDFGVYAATYYFQDRAKRVGEIKEIDKGLVVSFNRPPLKGLKKRKLVFSLRKEDLVDDMSSSAYHLLPHFPIGVGNRFYIGLDQGSLKGYNYAQWMILEPLKGKLAGAKGKIDEMTLGQLRKRYLPDKDSPLRNVVVTVRESTQLPAQEQAFLRERKAQIKPALEELLGMRVGYSEIPTVALAGSGGGYRAMLGYLGLLLGAEDSGLLDIMSYASALSGSTWTLGPWVSSGWTLDEFKDRLLGKIETDITKFTPDVKAILNELLMRMSFKQPITAVNVYGWILGHNLMADFPGGPLGTYVHNQASKIQDGSKPMPIYAAVATKLPYQWVEFTPWEFGGDYFGGYIPVWAFGAPFLDGTMRYFTPPYTLSFILAICGSAFAARLSRVVQEAKAGIPFSPLRKALEFSTQYKVGKHRASAARVFNWTWGMRPLPRAQQDIIKLIDAGISYNLPLESLYRRKADIIIITDFSAGKEMGDELRKAEVALRANGYKMPPIKYDGIETRPFSIFKDKDDTTVPVIIYIPQQNKACLKSYCNTFNFKYTRDQSSSLIKQSEDAMKEAAEAIKEELRLWIEAKR